MTIVLVTHEHDIAAFAGRLISFRDGRIVERHAPRRRAALAERIERLDRGAAEPA
jgi:putative ABC transport system ATP-binding protein